MQIARISDEELTYVVDNVADLWRSALADQGDNVVDSVLVRLFGTVYGPKTRIDWRLLPQAVPLGLIDESQFIINPAAERLRKAAKTSLSQHVEDFKKFMQDKGGDPKHVDQTINYINRLIKYSEVTHYSHLTAEGVLDALRRLQNEPVKGRHGYKTRSPRTANAYLVAIKSFCRWMARTKRVQNNPVETLEKFHESTDQRHERRAMTREEFMKLIEAADCSPRKVEGIDGPTRAPSTLSPP